MFYKVILSIVLIGILIQSSYTFPSEGLNEEDETQQQQQKINEESLEEFTKQLETKGKVEKLETDPDPDPCLEQKKVGPCKAAIPRIFFNKESGKCENFLFGGCGANKNNFKDFSKCEKVCQKHLHVTSILPVSSSSQVGNDEQEEICSQPPVQSGPLSCASYFVRWTFNATEGKCVEFVYEGCNGTKNNFRNKFQCESVCGGFKPNKQSEDNGEESDAEIIQQQQVVKEEPISTIMTQDVCSLPKQVGLCYAHKYRYHFNSMHNRCEKFVYGGCGGNGNNFKNVEDCLRTCGGNTPSEDPECSNVECPWELYTHYTTLRCQAIYDGKSCCPTRFDCPDKPLLNNSIEEGRSLNMEEDSRPKCQYKGKAYNIGEEVLEASDTGSCRAGCLCSEANGKAKINCAIIECPEHLGGIPPEKENCLPLYKRGSCCAYDFFCPNDTLTIIEPGVQVPLSENEFKCNVDGESFYQGQRFYPKKAKCSKCICSKGFNGTMSNQFCEDIDCGIEIYYSDYLARGCAPVYYQSADGSTSCCPYSWECPERPDETHDASSVSQSESSTPTTSEVGPVPVTGPPLVVPTTSTVEIFIPQNDSSSSRRGHKMGLFLLTQTACDLPKEIGNCKGQRQRYFYNKETNTCEQFTYSGCGQNDNNFVSIRDCQTLCIASKNTTDKDSDDDGSPLGRSWSPSSQQQQQTERTGPRAIYATEVDPCVMPKKTGSCKGYFLRYYFSPEDNSCKLFVYGGCRANLNNFHTKESCEATCTRSLKVNDLRTSVILGDSSRVKFGEDSVFSAKSINEEMGIDVCSLPKKIGACKAFIKRYYFDSFEKKCIEFGWGGCNGRSNANANNFKTMEACESRCPGDSANNPGLRSQTTQVQSSDDKNLPQIQDINSDKVSSWRSSYYLEKCRLPMKAGSCQASIPSYYYDVETETCTFFRYSGCFGNANRFSTLTECESECKKAISAASTQNEGIGGRMSVSGLPWRQSNIVASGGDTFSTMINSEAEGEPTIGSRSRGVGGSPIVKLPLPEEANAICQLPPTLGPCRAHILRFYWDPSIQQCLPFIYSGCRGNRNNFVSETDCLSVCGKQPTIEELTSNGVLSCTFGNETLSVGATVKKYKQQNKKWNSEDLEQPCGVPICQCITPPSVTCFQTSCPTTPIMTTMTTTTEKVCPTPSCGANCKEAIGLDGCPTCDCNDTQAQVQIEEIFIKE